MVRHVLGAPPILMHAAAWRSFAGDDGAMAAKDAQHFHYDLDDHQFCKYFIYLTDVDGQSGPHAFVPRTHRPDVLASIHPEAGTHAYDTFRQWYFNTLRKSDADVAKHIPIAPIEITGPAGSRFLVNTEGIHRGVPPITRDRWIVQFVYAVTPATEWASAYAPSPPRTWEGTPVKAVTPEIAYLMRSFFPALRIAAS